MQLQDVTDYKCAYCYLRRNKPFGVDVVKNLDDIIQTIDDHLNTLQWPKFPDQTHERYWTYDLGCNTDIALHYKHQDFNKLFDYFKYNEKAFGSFATKRVNKHLLNYNPNRKLRIRFSLMPESFREILEPKTSTIIERIKAVNDFYDAGWDVHLNYSPVIAYNQSSDLYEALFRLVNKHIRDDIKPHVLSEVIFLTHDERMHLLNIKENPEAEVLLWQPKYQEYKQSAYGGKVLRYRYKIKSKMTDKFIKIHSEIIPWNKIRYIF